MRDEGLRSLIQPSVNEAEEIRALWIALCRDGREPRNLPQLTEVDSGLPGFQLVWPDGRPFKLPPSLTAALMTALETFMQGDGVFVVPSESMLTTGEAADLLGVSRTYLIKLIEQGRLPCRLVGSHRRLRSEDVLAFRRKWQSIRRDAMRRHDWESERLNLP